MYHYTYVIHHTSGHFYVGVRTSKVPPEHDTSYWGSSKVLDELLADGRDGWTKEILATYDSRFDASEGEADLTSPEFLNNPFCLNQCQGGGGWHKYADRYKGEIGKRIGAALKGKKMPWVGEVMRGRTLTEEHKRKCGDALRGRRFSAEHKAKIAAKLKGIKRPELTCPHCGKAGVGQGIMSRWHFENCKFKGPSNTAPAVPSPVHTDRSES